MGPGPGPVTPGAPAASIEGSSFTGLDGNDRINFYFRKSGILHYRDPQGWWEDGRWSQTGATVTWTVTDGFATYTGTLAGDALTGTATNRNGKSWGFRLSKGTPRQPPSVDLNGQDWGGKEDKTCIVFHFKPGGVLEYDTPSGHYTDGTWEVDGEWVYFKHASTGFEYFGSVSGDRMNGNLWSTTGQRWSWDVNRGVAPPDCGGKPAATPVPQIASIEGSTWSGDNGGDPIELRFKASGLLEATDNDGNWVGTWFQNGAVVNFDLNSRYSWYTGTLSGTTLAGDAENKDGTKWKFRVQRK
jgi:hypothetical protein